MSDYNKTFLQHNKTFLQQKLEEVNKLMKAELEEKGYVYVDEWIRLLRKELGIDDQGGDQIVT